jgi:threonylcarbamoyladenosine tRNA methylthiotransferase MtaB
MKYCVVTFGCRVNQADSLTFEEGLQSRGASAAPAEQADVVVINTCSVTGGADQGARQAIRRIARVNPAARIIVTGCYATRAPHEILALPNVARVVSNDDKERLVTFVLAPRSNPIGDEGQVLEEPISTSERFGIGDGGCGAAIEPGIAGRTAFTLRVQTGCDEPCAYCIIPATRGRPRSVPLVDLLCDIVRVCEAGFKEIALTGVHLGSYGRDLAPQTTLEDLLRAIAARYGRGGRDLLFRISSLEPMDCSPGVVELVAGDACFAQHFHLPLQHASNRVLNAMRRPYTIEQYAALVERVRGAMPNASIGSDVIVGFPGETDKDFEALVDYLEGSPLTHVHVFPYSDRPGTVSAGMAGKIPGTVVRDRARRVRDVSARLTAAFRASQLGSVHRGLTLEDGSLVVTGNYLKLKVPPGRARNEWVDVRVTSHDGGELLTG